MRFVLHAMPGARPCTNRRATATRRSPVPISDPSTPRASSRRGYRPRLPALAVATIATATAASPAASAATASTAPPTATTLFARTSQVDHELAVTQGLAIEHADGLLRLNLGL